MNVLKKAWLGHFIGAEKLLYAEDHALLEKVYQVEDPWSAASTQHQRRFDAVNQVVRERLEGVKTALELGSGEGHHTKRLLEVCAEVDGVESSPTALSRARERCPKARFFEGRLPALPKGLRKSYDLVVASEVLYYLREPAKTVAAMNRLGKHCLVTFAVDHAGCLSGLFQDIPGVLGEDISYRDSTWKLYLWKPPRRTARS